MKWLAFGVTLVTSSAWASDAGDKWLIDAAWKIENRHVERPPVEPAIDGDFDSISKGALERLAEKLDQRIRMNRARWEELGGAASGTTPLETLSPAAREVIDAERPDVDAVLRTTHARVLRLPAGLTLFSCCGGETMGLNEVSTMGQIEIRQALALDRAAEAAGLCRELFGLGRDATFGYLVPRMVAISSWQKAEPLCLSAGAELDAAAKQRFADSLETVASSVAPFSDTLEKEAVFQALTGDNTPSARVRQALPASAAALEQLRQARRSEPGGLMNRLFGAMAARTSSRALRDLAKSADASEDAWLEAQARFDDETSFSSWLASDGAKPSFAKYRAKSQEALASLRALISQLRNSSVASHP